MEDLFKTKQSRCRFSHLGDIGNDIMHPKINYNCIREGLANDKVRRNVSEKECENCPHFKSRFIEYPITVSKINVTPFDPNDTLRKSHIGDMVKIRPCAKECEEKTYLGIFLGELPQSPYISHDPRTNELNIYPLYNPAIFVPELKRIVFGCESWWGFINSEEELKDITNDTIANQWYVRMAKEMFGGAANDN